MISFRGFPGGMDRYRIFMGRLVIHPVSLNADSLNSKSRLCHDIYKQSKLLAANVTFGGLLAAIEPSSPEGEASNF